MAHREGPSEARNHRPEKQSASGRGPCQRRISRTGPAASPAGADRVQSEQTCPAAGRPCRSDRGVQADREVLVAVPIGRLAGGLVPADQIVPGQDHRRSARGEQRGPCCPRLAGLEVGVPGGQTWLGGQTGPEGPAQSDQRGPYPAVQNCCQSEGLPASAQARARQTLGGPPSRRVAEAP